jgi:hypothetical protein
MFIGLKRIGLYVFRILSGAVWYLVACVIYDLKGKLIFAFSQAVVFVEWLFPCIEGIWKERFRPGFRKSNIGSNCFIVDQDDFALVACKMMRS